MKLNFYEAWNFHNMARIKTSFREWLKTKPQGKIKILGEWQDDGMCQIDEADDNADFKAWLKSKREAMKRCVAILKLLNEIENGKRLTYNNL